MNNLKGCVPARDEELDNVMLAANHKECRNLHYLTRPLVQITDVYIIKVKVWGFLRREWMNKTVKSC